MNTYRVTATIQNGKTLTGVAFARTGHVAIRKMRGALLTCSVSRIRAARIHQGSGFTVR